MTNIYTHTPHPMRIQRKRTKGFRLPDGAVCITRPGRWANPFKVADAIECGYADGRDAAAFVVQCFRDWLYYEEEICWRIGKTWWGGPASVARRRWILEHLDDLQGKQLACWCPLDEPCHGDVLAALANPLHVSGCRCDDLDDDDVWP